ncbi:MAG: hypothetical protein EB127_09325 [Alphaproteobacteria bacterium]|nr:hypothetical protein [Alphaproteobacteria bacterium]
MRILLTLVIIAAILLFAFLVRDRIYGKQKELFGTSPGTMVQLATSHVPTEEDEYWALKGYAQQVNHDLVDMTGAPLYN